MKSRVKNELFVIFIKNVLFFENWSIHTIGVEKKMIERYSREEMSNIWTDQNRYEEHG